MRRLALLLALFLAGCLDPGGRDLDLREDAGPPVVADAFDRVDAPWVAQVAGGCGFCSGATGFRGDGEHHSLFVFDDGRVLLVEWNGWHRPPGELHVHENVTFDRAQLQRLLVDSPRGRDGDLWVMRVTTARLADEGLVGELRDAWATGSADTQCTDSGVSYLLRHANASVEEQPFTCGPAAGEPLTWFAETMHALVDATRAGGVAQGEPLSAGAAA